MFFSSPQNVPWKNVAVRTIYPYYYSSGRPNMAGQKNPMFPSSEMNIFIHHVHVPSDGYLSLAGLVRTLDL